MELIIERVFSSFLIITGLSYLLQSLVWKNFVQDVLKKPTWLMLWSILFLPWGLIIIFGHNLWLASGSVLITVLGWIITIKCSLSLLLPSWATFVNQWSDDFLRRYIQTAGVIEAILGTILLVFSFRL